MKEISLPALLMLSLFSSLASADIPTELGGNWHPCSGDFGNHTADVNEQWQIGAIDFVVAKLPGSESTFFLDVRGAQAESLRDVTWHIVEGKDGAMKLPKLDPQDFCKSGSSPVLDPTPGDYTYMIGIADLSSKSDDGQYCGPTPHIVMFEPLEVGPQKQKYFALTVTHLGDKCATGAHHKSSAGKKNAARSFGPAKVVVMHNGVVHGHP